MAQSIVLIITEPSLETSCRVYPKVVWLSDVLHLVTLVHHGTWLSQFYLHQVKGVVIPGLRGDTSLLSQLQCALREWWSHNPRRSSANIDTAESSEMMLLHSEIQNRTCQDGGLMLIRIQMKCAYSVEISRVHLAGWGVTNQSPRCTQCWISECSGHVFGARTELST